MTLLGRVAEVAARAKVVQRDRALRPVETRLASAMRKAFGAHQAAFMAEFERTGKQLFGEAASTKAIDDALETAYRATLADFTGPLEDATEASIAAAAKHRIAEFGIDLAFDLKNPGPSRPSRTGPLRPSPTSTPPPATKSHGSSPGAWKTATATRRWRR